MKLKELVGGGVFDFFKAEKTPLKSVVRDNKIFRWRLLRSLGMDTQDIINLITINNSVRPVGSFRFKIHRYPSDIDIFEPVTVCCSKGEALKFVVSELQDIARKTKRSKTIFWGDFKAGVDAKYVPLQGERRSDYVSRTGKKVKGANWQEDAREFYIVRWTQEEVIKGVKKLKSGSMLNLSTALTHNTIVKLDLWATVAGNYTGVTNFFLLSWKEKDGKKHVINAELGDRLKSLEKDIKKYGSKEKYNPLKLAKRCWNKALYLNDYDLTETLYPLFSSGAAAINQITGELETMRFMYEKLTDQELPKQKLQKQLDGFKRRLIDLLDIDVNKNVYKMIDNAFKEQNKKKKIHLLQEIEQTLDGYSKRFTASWLKANNISTC